MNKYIIPIIVAILFFSCNSQNHKADAYGNFEAIETVISSEANGKLIKFNIEEGVEVKAGQQIGVIDTTDMYLNKQQAISQKRAVSSKITTINAQLEVLKVQFKTLKNEKERLGNLLDGGAATEKQMDDLDAQIRVLKAQIEATKTQKKSVYSELDVVQKQIDQIDHRIQKCYLEIPKNGVILNKYVEVSELVVQGKALYKIADLTSIILRAYISGSQLHEIKLGEKVTVYIDKNKDENIEFEGKVSWISESAEFTPKIIQTKEERVDLVYAIKIKVQNDGRIKIGMPGEVYFQN